MSDVLNTTEIKRIEEKITVTSPPEDYLNRENAVDVVLGLKIPLSAIKKWHEKVHNRNGNKRHTYTTLLNDAIPSHFMKINEKYGRIEELLSKKAGSVVKKNHKCKNGRERKKLTTELYTLCLRDYELISFDDIEEELKSTREAIEEWKRTVEDLEVQKKDLMKDLIHLLKQKDGVIDDSNAQNEELRKYIANLEAKNKINGCNGKKIHNLGDRQQLRRLAELKSKAQLALWFLKPYGLELSFMKLNDAVDSEKRYTFSYSNSGSTEKEDDKKVEQVLFLLDKFCGSDDLYHELSMVFDGVPKSYLIKQKRNDLNSLCMVEAIPGKYPGAQLSFKNTLREHIEDYLLKNPQHSEDEAIKIKISGDGAKMSRNTNFMIMSFCLLQTGEKVMSSKGNRTIGIFSGPEDYAAIKEAFSSLIKEINELIDNGSIEINGKSYKTEVFLGGDYKFLLMIMGLSNTTSDFACLWCLIHKLNRWDTSKTLEYFSASKMKRTLEQIKSKVPKKQHSCIHEPLINIELDHIILDELHLMLRVTDRLLENLITEVMQRDSKLDFDKCKKDRKGIYLGRLVTTINSLGITFSIWEKKNADGKGSGTYDWTSLLGSERKKLMKLLPAKLESEDILYPETKDAVVKLWVDFLAFYETISSLNTTSDQYKDISESGKAFINLFCSLGDKRLKYTKARVTPYMHAMAYHVPVMIKEYSNLKQFTGQGVEKNNDDAKRVFFQKSNKWDGARDVLLLEARQIALQHYERTKRKYEKSKDEYWDKGGIAESRSKRIKTSK